ncbi:peptidoglycan-binding protein [Streptomyces sp. AK02-01A]|uniref:peptidoglycan-binding protein n=1 Tax=Streptomyces sp. AK02-01A TaxID=3028648 RepID=UPI0029B14654|nr:peptidoglycan-binding protein [Streptomyces sp. AK02-01A]MDX3849165.1 peptidoglycan-binding protein [Streptomyces sp. AK02-01A]
MAVPVFEEYEPALDCPCAGCAEQRRDLARGLPVRAGGHPAAHGARRALVLVTAAGVALGATAAAADLARAENPPSGPAGPLSGPARTDAAAFDPEPVNPQGGVGPLHGRPLPGPPGSGYRPPALRKSTRADIINRAKRWVDARVPYSMDRYWYDGYRQDCSGYVSMAWNLGGNEWTGSLAEFGVRVEWDDLEPGDILLFHNPSDPNRGSHVTIFGGWTEYTHSYYMAYEQTQTHTRMQPTPLAYWSNSRHYEAYRYRELTGGGVDSEPVTDGVDAGTGTAASPEFPGASAFGTGANNAYVTRLGEMLTRRGGAGFYRQGPGPRWGEADRRATQAFQLAQGWRGSAADGLPGQQTWRYLVNGLGKDIKGAPVPVSVPTDTGGTAEASVFPGSGYFRPGQSNSYVARLGRQLMRKGFGRHYLSGPGPRWTEADRRNVEAFQRAQGWRGTAADGYPGPQTWRRLFA